MTPSPGAQALARARETDSQRRRERVQTALKRLTAAGEEISVAAVARAAKVSRAFLYRHRDLHTQVLERAAAGQEPAAATATTVSRGSLLAEVATLRDRNLRLARQVAKLEAKLSETLGEQVFAASGLGAPDTSSSSSGASTPWSRRRRSSPRRSRTWRTSLARPGRSTGS